MREYYYEVTELDICRTSLIQIAHSFLIFILLVSRQQLKPMEAKWIMLGQMYEYSCQTTLEKTHYSFQEQGKELKD